MFSFFVFCTVSFVGVKCLVCKVVELEWYIFSCLHVPGHVTQVCSVAAHFWYLALQLSSECTYLTLFESSLTWPTWLGHLKLHTQITKAREGRQIFSSISIRQRTAPRYWEASSIAATAPLYDHCFFVFSVMQLQCEKVGVTRLGWRTIYRLRLAQLQ